MQVPPHSMSHKLSHYAKAVLFDRILNGRAHRTETTAFSRLFDTGIEGVFRNLQQPLHFFRNFADRNGSGSITDKAVKDYADIELNQVSVLDSALATDSMNNLIIERYTDITGKLLVSQKSAAATGIRHQPCCCQIDLLGGHTRTEHCRYLVENLAGQAAGRPHLLNFLPRLYWNHPAISLAMSAKTTSASRPASISTRRFP